METFSDRLNYLKNMMGYSNEKIADRVTAVLANSGSGKTIKRAAVQKWMKGLSKPNHEEVERALAEVLGQSVAWLMHGIDKSTASENELAKLITTLTPDHQRMIREMISALRGSVRKEIQ